jgi:hypothetical protein
VIQELSQRKGRSREYQSEEGIGDLLTQGDGIMEDISKRGTEAVTPLSKSEEEPFCGNKIH